MEREGTIIRRSTSVGHWLHLDFITSGLLSNSNERASRMGKGRKTMGERLTPYHASSFMVIGGIAFAISIVGWIIFLPILFEITVSGYQEA